ncbi:MAG: hypothetical protein JWM51_44, partial [Microbacteriaceae bacterium]|nr:hypothetical protein [Microbacteriaceae bacterium]
YRRISTQYLEHDAAAEVDDTDEKTDAQLA